MKENHFDIIVIGAGAAGLNIASFTNRIGLKICLMSKTYKSIGGDCLNTGCVPSKAFIHLAREVHAAKKAEALGLHVEGEVDLEKVSAYVHEKIETFRPTENAAHFRKKGIEVVLGAAKFTGKNSVYVEGTTYTARKIVIATGSKPREFTAPGSENVTIHTNESIFDLTTLPKELLVIGGGPISLELGQALSRFGSKVTILEHGDHFLPKEDPEISAIMKERLEKEGVTIHLNASVQKFINSKKAEVLIGDTTQEVTFDAVFAAIGRIINVSPLNAEKAGIEVDDRGKIISNDYLQTTNKNIYVAGDVAGGFQFTHMAEVHAKVILNNFFSPFKKKLSVKNFGWVTYTDPEIASFGLQEYTLKKEGIAYECINQSLEEDDRAIVDDYRWGRMKMFVSPKGKILGGTLIAPHAGEITQELLLAIHANLPIKKVFSKVYPYPTATRINFRTFAKYLGSKVTPFQQKLLKFLFH